METTKASNRSNLGWLFDHMADNHNLHLTDTELHDLAEVARSVDAPTGTEAKVVEDIRQRQQRGITKYGQTVEANPAKLREWLQHAYEEALDMAVYLRRAIDELPKDS